jgi:hypothetical protein
MNIVPPTKQWGTPANTGAVSHIGPTVNTDRVTHVDPLASTGWAMFLFLSTSFLACIHVCYCSNVRNSASFLRYRGVASS